ncbi:MAG TPA: glycosyltransferase family 4 protein [Candidatus Baltobacteraceae bacterium]
MPEFPPDTIGGGGRVFEGLALAMHARGHSVRVLTSSTVGGPACNDSGYPFPIARVKQFKHFTPQYRTYMPPLPRELFRFRNFLRGSDVYHLHGYGVAFVDSVFHFLTDWHKTVFTNHGFPYTAPRAGGMLSAAYRLYDAAFGVKVLKNSCRLTAVSSFAAGQVESAIGRSVEVIPNGFAVTIAQAIADAALREFMIGGPYILCVGRIEPLKGFDLVVRALRKLRDNGSGLRLIVAGSDNSQGASLARLVSELGLTSAVIFAGRLEHSALMSLYQSASYCVVSSYTESFSLVTLEAMSQGTPSVLSAVGGILDIARDAENALLFSPGDVNGIAAAIARLESSPLLRARLILNGRSTVEKYAWPEVAARYEATYLACAATSQLQ